MNAEVTAAVSPTVLPLMLAIRVPAGIPEAVTVMPTTRLAAVPTKRFLLESAALPVVITVANVFEP